MYINRLHCNGKFTVRYILHTVRILHELRYLIYPIYYYRLSIGAAIKHELVVYSLLTFITVDLHAVS